jgi:pimeloyl-ACP methyl ester carboxylesterase
MPARGLATVLATLVLAGCGMIGVRGKPEACTRVQSERQVRGDTLCEDAFLCVRPPGGRFDRIGLRRLALCDGANGPVVLYLPGMHMNAELPQTDARYDFRMHLALAGVRAWGLDYRTHSVPAEATPADLRTLESWTASVFTDDAAWAAEFVRGIDPGPLYVAGFSYGAGVAYGLAARRVPLAGLIILDGTPPGESPAPEGGAAAIDVGGGRLSWADRQRLLRTVLASPDNPSPVPGSVTAGAALADVVYSSPSFGGEGGLSAAKEGITDVVPLARLLESYDRWWPRAALRGDKVSPRGQLPLIAFASQRMGAAWIERVRAGAKAFGGDQAIVRVLPRYGHLDVLVGQQAARLVFEPVLGFLGAASP